MIVPMKKITLIALRDDEEKIIHALQKSCIAEIIPPEEADDGLNAELFGRFDAELRDLTSASDVLKPYAKKPFILAPLPEVTVSELEDENVREDAREISDEVRTLTEQMRDIKAEITKREQSIAQTEPLCAFDVPLESFRGTKHTGMVCGTVTESALYELKQQDTVMEYAECGKGMYICIVYMHREDEDDVMHKLASVGFTSYSVPAFTGTAQENVNRLREECAALQAEHDEKQKRIATLARDMDKLLLCVDAVNAEYDRLKAMAELLKSQYAFIMRAWVCAQDAQTAEDIVKRETDGAYYMEISDPGEDEMPPSVVTSSEPFSSFEAVTNMYSRPAYGAIDASPLITPFYMLFFAMMLGDVGYGLLLFVGTILFNALKKPTGGTKKAVKMFTWCGLATMICGFLFGTFFGMDIDTIFGTTDVFPLLMDPMKNVMEMLVLCCGLGMVHMIFGLCIKIYMCMRSGDVQSAIFDNLSWIFLLLGGIGAALLPKPYGTASLIAAFVGLGLILAFGGRGKKGVMRILGGFGSLYNITSWLSDTVSYARVFAIGLVGGAMGSVFNLIGGMIAGAGSGFAHVITVILAAVVLIIMHLFSLFINTLSAFAHTARLQYVEFFGKFYEGGGREFRPLGINAKNVRVAREDALTQKQ